jgi:glycosyltransferase involved in cell wall biosynthesis
MRRHVLFISSWYPNPHNKTHGIFVKRTAEAVALANKVSVIHVYGHESFPDEVRIESKTENNVEEIFVFFKKKHTNPFTKFLNYKRYYEQGLNYLLKHSGSPDLIQLNVLFPAGIAAYELAESLKIPLVVSEHWTGFHPEDGSYHGLIQKYFSIRAARRAAHIVTVSKNLQEAMIAHRLKGNYSVIPNVVNTEVFKCVPRLKPIFRFLHVSSLDPRQKNTGGIINAFKKLNQANSETELMIVGNGENKTALEEKAGKLLNRSIFFAGQRLGAALADEFNEAHCLVLFSNYENLPVVILEAMCCGVPVISSDVGGIKEFLKPEHGMLVSPLDENGLLEAMKKMIVENKKYDREKISAYGAQHFCYQKISDMYSQVYEDVLKNNHE